MNHSLNKRLIRNLFLVSTILLIILSCEKEPIQYTLNISPRPSNAGFVNPTQGVYDAGEKVQILASTVNQNFRFVNWTGDFAGNAPIATITMDRDKIIYGNFEDTDLDRDGVLNNQDLCIFSLIL